MLDTCQVRGAPAIAVVGILSLVAEVYEHSFTSVTELRELIEKRLDNLVTARPTAVNMADARSKLLQQLQRWTQDKALTSDELKHKYVLNTFHHHHHHQVVVSRC